MQKNGFGLLEVLITLVVISVGLLALATMNMTTYQQALDAEFRQTAVFLAEDLKNRMLMNRNEIKAGWANSVYNDPASTKAANNATCSSQSTCSPAQIAALDLYQVYNLVNNLPNGKLTVCMDSNGSTACNGSAWGGTIPFFNINISWSNGHATESYQIAIPFQ